MDSHSIGTAEVVAATRIMRKMIMLSHKLVLLSNIRAFTCLCPTVVCKGGVGVTGAVKILALPKRGGGV